MWTQLVGHSGYDNGYGGSGVSGNFLLVGYNTNKSHQTSSPSPASDVELVTIRTDSGYVASTTCQLVLTSAQSQVRLMDLVVTPEHGIYALANVTAGSVQYIQSGVTYEFAQDSYAILLFQLDAVTAPTIPTVDLLDVMSVSRKNAGFGGYAISRLLLYYPSGYEEYGVPELLLVGHLSPAERTGLLIFAFTDQTCASTTNFAASYNPFVTDQGCDSSCARCLSSTPTKCMQCASSTSFLAERFSCTASACPSGYYMVSSKHCERCHGTCLTCSGPLKTQCTSCDSSLYMVFNMYTGECQCSSSKPYSSNGACVSTCSVGQSAVVGDLNICRNRCPAHTINFVDYESGTVQAVKAMLSVAEGADMLEFSPSSSSCLVLPGPTDAVTLPDQFTASFWLYPLLGWTAGTKSLLWAFNALSVECDVSGGVYTVKLTLHLTSGDLVLVSSPTYALLTAGEWNFVAASVKRTSGSYVAYLYVTSTSTTVWGDATRSSSASATLEFAKYVNKVYLGCAASVRIDGTDTLAQGVDFSGYVRELVYQGRYYERVNIDDRKNLVYGSCLEVYKGLLGYWRFDDIPAVTGGYQLQDSSRFGQTVVLPTGGVPGKKTSAAILGTGLCNAEWEAVGTCVDLFESSNYPRFSLNLRNFGAGELGPRINFNAKSTLSKIVQGGDQLRYTFGDCDTGAILASASIVLQSGGSVTVESDKSLPYAVMGRHVNVCYHSAVGDTSYLLGRTYFVSVPQQIFPSHGASEKAATTPLTFRLVGGDQSAYDLLTLVNIEKDTATGLADTMVVDESLATYGLYSAAKQSNGSYSQIATASLDRGIYTIAWRPGYMYETVTSEQMTYKNLFITWAMQDTPKAKFPPVSGIANTYKNSVVFKAELLYLTLVGLGQRDGDQVILCYIGCHYSNRVGPTFTRVNGNYPPLWFGEAAGVYNLLDKSTYDRVYICWRSSARAAQYDADDDAWYSVLDLQKANSAAYILINSMDTNEYLPEILATNPPMTNPVLHPGETIWFQISKCSSEKTKPTMYSGVPGRVQLLHVTYSTYNHTSYTTEVVWEQAFASFADFSSTTCTVGNLVGEYSTCNYTLQNLPQSLLKPGHDYMLGIYSRSFVTSNGDYLFGAVDPGVLQFKYIFTYQEAEFAVTYRKISPTETAITIGGANLGDLAVAGNGFTDTRRLFGVIVTPTVTPACSSLDSGYIALSRYASPTEIVLKGINMTLCNGTLGLDMKLIKISDYADAPLWYYTSTVSTLSVGFIGCHYTCKTCNGTEYTDCLTCNSSTSLRFWYKGQCVAQCPEDQPYPELVLAAGTSTIEYYRCVQGCDSGYYLDANLGYCVQCNSQCRTCTSGNTMSCVDCKGTAVAGANTLLDYNNTYQETYYFKRMCMLSCPDITNYFSTSQKLVSYNYYIHTCKINSLPSGVHPISVSVQPIMYPQKVSIKRAVSLRALVSDSTGNLAGLSWVAHPAEDTTASGFTSSDKRVFDSYSDDTLNSTVVALNMNAFNYKGENDEMRIVVQAWTSDSMNFDVFELYGNRPPELNDDDVSFSPSSGFTTESYINITLTNVEDADDSFQLLKFKVFATPRSYVLPDSYESTTSDTVLQLLAQITAKTITIYPSTLETNIVDSTVTLTNIYIPPLINGPQLINDEVLSSKVSADILIYVEDRFMGVTKSKFTVNITESYTSVSRTATLSALRSSIMAAVADSSMSWRLALRAAHTFAVASPSSSHYYMSYTACTRDSQCGGHGECVISGGWSECVCDNGYVGITCDWARSELSMAQDVSKTVLQFLNDTVLTPFQKNLKDNAAYTASDTNVLDQVANVIMGLLKNPETVSSEYMPLVVQLFNYMTRIDIVVGARLLDFEKANILAAVDCIIKFVYQSLRETIFAFYVLDEARRSGDQEVEANYTERREELAGQVITMRDGLYRFASAISTAQYPGDSPYYVAVDTFVLFVSAVREETMFQDLGGSLGLQLDSSSGYVKLPTNVLSSVRKSVSYNGEFKIRAVKWTESPYVFSDYHAEVSTPLYSLALLDSNGTTLSLNLTEPIVFFLPLINATKNFPSDRLMCKYFDDSTRMNVTRAVTKKINVNTLNMTDTQKKWLYPEWQPKLYSNSDLIVETKEYETVEAEYPEFVDSKGISGYGNVLKLGEYVDTVPCVAYHLSEVAAVVQRRQSLVQAQRHIEFYNSFDPLETINFTIGIYVCVVLGSLFIAGMFVTWFVDIMLIPKLERIISLHRREYSEKDQDANTPNEVALEQLAGKNISLVLKAEENKGFEDTAAKSSIKLKGDDSGNSSGSGSGGRSPGGPGEEVLPEGDVAKVHKASSAGESSGEYSSGEGSSIGSVEEEVKVEGGSIIKVRRHRKKRHHRHHAINADTAAATTQDDLKKKTTITSIVSQSQGKSTDTKEGGDTSMNHTTTQEMSSTVGVLHATTTKFNSTEEGCPEKAFAGVKAKEIRTKKNKGANQIEDIFSKEYIARAEESQFKPLNIYFAANPILNMCLRTSTVYTRPMRCMLLFSYLYFTFFWAAILLSDTLSQLDHPEDTKRVSALVAKDIWVIAFAPILTNIIMFLAGGIFKLNEAQVRNSKTTTQYRMHMYIRA